MKKLFTVKSLMLALMAAWFAHATGLPHVVLARVSSALEFVQKTEIARLANQVGELEAKEAELDDEIESVRTLSRIADTDDLEKLDRRVSHLERRKDLLSVEIGEIIEKIDSLTDTQQRVIASRNIALGYVGNVNEPAIWSRATDREKLSQARAELKTTETELAELEAERARLMAELETERFAEEVRVRKQQTQKDRDWTRRKRGNQETRNALNDLEADDELSSQFEPLEGADAAAAHAVSYVVLRGEAGSRPQSFLKTSSQARRFAR